ncbi:MAG: ABC transporter ATP-binding protein, partial [Pseudomonadota bacterium]
MHNAAHTGSSPPRGEPAASVKPSPVWRLLAPVRLKLVVACILQGFSAAIGVVPFIAVAELGRVLLAEGPVDSQHAWMIAWIGAGSLVLRLVFMMAAVGLTHLADVDFRLDLRRRMVERLSRVPLGWFSERTSGQVKKALQDDVTTLHHLVGHGFVNLTSALVTPIVALGYLLWVEWRLTLVVALHMLLGVLSMYALQMRGYGEKMRAYDAALGRVNAASVEFVQGIAVVKTFGQTGRPYGRFIEEARRFLDFFWNWVKDLMRLSAVSEVILSPLACLAVSLSAGTAMVAVGWTTPIDVLPFALLGVALTAPFLTLAYTQNELMLARQAAERIGALLDTPVLPDRVSGKTPSGTRIAYEGVCFSYDDGPQVLTSIDLVLEPGTITALVGPSGSGKTTLARLLPRFWDPTAGRITLGGVPIDELPQDELYRRIVFVFQDVQLLHASVRENIALARPDAPMDEIEAAARAAQIHERILDLPQGYDTVVGEDARLSGGEAQRVSIARAILADAPIIVLDEATAF